MDNYIIPFKYILTEISLEFILFYINHPKLKPFVDKNILDFAVFDAVKDNKVNLKYKRRWN